MIQRQKDRRSEKKKGKMLNTFFAMKKRNVQISGITI